jgi:hypothetical protein
VKLSWNTCTKWRIIATNIEETPNRIFRKATRRQSHSGEMFGNTRFEANQSAELRIRASGEWPGHENASEAPAPKKVAPFRRGGDARAPQNQWL